MFDVVEGKVAGLFDDAQVVEAAGFVTETVHEVQKLTCAASASGSQATSPDADSFFYLSFFDAEFYTVPQFDPSF